MDNFVAGLFVGLTLMILMIAITDAQSGKTIIHKGCAEYNSTTGDFQWIIK